MISIRLCLALVVAACAVAAYAGHVEHHHKGWGWPKYHGWAEVSHWQNPHAYQYGLKESGKGWAKQVWVGQEFKGWHHG